jgi:ferric-dicitrate binding protein FerR (iron transport regulator)
VTGTHGPLDPELAALWTALDRLSGESFPAREDARRRWREAGARRTRRRLALAGLAALLALAVALPLGIAWHHRGAVQLEAGHATGPGARERLSLPDGSTVWLNVSSRAVVRYTGARRDVVLEAGEALFTVSRDERRPFEVAAGPVRVRALGTAFNVRLREDAVEIAVRHGRIAVAPAAGPGTSITLEAGERTTFSIGRPPGPVLRSDPEAVGAWSQGWIKLERAPLGLLVAELARYHPLRIAMRPDAASLQVSGAFRIDDPHGVLRMLPRVLPVAVAVDRAGDYTIRAVR